MFTYFQKIYHEFPRRFWLVVGVSFIDRIGGTLLFPFFALYITQRFGVGMTEAGVLLGWVSIWSLLGNVIGGALTDRFGRRRLILFGLIFSAFSMVALGLVNSYLVLFPVGAVIGLLADVAGPAHQAMLADILPEEKRQEGFGILRVVANISWIIGPVIGGIVANRSFFALFVIDALISCIVAFLFYRLIPETKPAPHEDAIHETMGTTFSGYLRALRDFPFVGFILAAILMGSVYQQMYNTLSVYLRDNHGITPQGYGILLTFSAITVILFQFWTTRVIKTRPPFLMMALGVIFYAIGFSMFAYVGQYLLFGGAIVIITIGEMIVMPTSSALAANFAPEDMRGRYMALFGLTWLVPSIFAPAAAGYLLDNFDPELLWQVGGLLCILAAICFYVLHARLGRHERFSPAPPEVQAAPASSD